MYTNGRMKELVAESYHWYKNRFCYCTNICFHLLNVFCHWKLTSEQEMCSSFYSNESSLSPDYVK